MPHTCDEPNCTQKVWGGLKCKFHQYLRRMAGGDLYKQGSKPRSPKSNTIHRRTPKRATDERYYAVQAKEFFQDAVNNKTNHCFFCGEKVNTFQGLHHLQGRRNKNLLDFSLIVIVHNSCHLFYHRATVEQLQATSWYNGFLSRLRSKSIDAYNKELRKLQKSLFESQ